MKLYNIILLVFCLIAIACKQKKEAGETPKFSLTDKMVSTMKTESTELKTLKNELTFYGRIAADNNKLIEVYPIVGGNVTKVYVELGDYVKKGQLLATIQSTDVAEFENNLENAKNDVIVAKNNLKVAQELFEGKLNTEREVVEAKSNYDKAVSNLNRSKQTYNVYNIKKGAIYEVRSPLNGFIIQKNINQDMLLRNDKSDNIFDVAEINRVWAIANVNESDINQVKLGIDAEVTTLSYPDKKFYGKVDKIYNIIDPETKAMKAIINLNNTDFQLKPEMTASIKLSYEENRKMIGIPSDAIIFDNSKNFVMIFKDKSHIETRQVDVYRQVGNITYISSGLNEGEKVIINNQLLIYDALND